jgi:RNA polymerase sigma-70 factor (ECF subfamily)
MAIDFIRKKNREMPMEELPEDDSGGSPPTAGEDSNVNVISVRDAISTLSPPEQTVVNMKILSDMTFKEIAESLGQPIGTITWRYNEAIKKLRTILASTA